MSHSLATHSVECARLFNTLISAAENGTHSPFNHATLEDQLVRFKIWAGTLGAFQQLPSTTSLEYRLRNSRRIADHVESLLVDLVDVLRDVSTIASGRRQNRKAENGTSEVDELSETAKGTISCLFRIAVLIRRASPRDRYARALAATESPFDASFDIRHVCDKFPRIIEEKKAWLGDRLGNAIAQRRQYLSYTRSHRDKLGKEYPQPYNEGELDAGKLGETKSFTQTTASTLHSANIPQLDYEDDRSIASSTLSLPGNNDESHLRPPLLSLVSNGEAMFECPFCWSMQSFQKETSWQKHVYIDLRPYVCTFAGCQANLFSDQAEWFEHESEHRTQWRCSLCHVENMDSETDFRAHILSHTNNVTNDQLTALSKAARCPPDRFRAAECPFCCTWSEKLRKAIPDQDEPTVTPVQYMKHVGSHMRQLALFALPREFVDEVEDTSATEDEMDVKPAETMSATDSNAHADQRDDRGNPDIEKTADDLKQRNQSGSGQQKTTEVDWEMIDVDIEPGTKDQGQDAHSSISEEAQSSAKPPNSQSWGRKGFIFRIEEIGEHPNGPVVINNKGFWVPSTSPGHIRVGGGVSGEIWLCDFQGIQPLNLPLPSGANLYAVTSAYYCAGYGFWALMGDATQPDEECWRPLTFDHDYSDYSSYLSNAGSMQTLRCQRPDQLWPKMLLPGIYQVPPTPTNSAYGGMKGDLALFLALIAFSLSKEHLQQYLISMLIGGKWQVHGLPHGRTHQRGVVVYVYTYPGGFSQDDLRQYEDGVYGHYYN